MARERYLLDMDESAIHSNIITADTKKEKFKNWWYYNKVKLLIYAIIIACVASLFYSILSKVEPDYVIGCLYGSYIDDDLFKELESQLEIYADDRNGDGKVVVELRNYALTTSMKDAYDYNMQQAAYVQAMADLSEGESIVWLVDNDGMAVFGADGEDLFVDIDDDETVKSLMFNDIKAFENLDFSLYEGTQYNGEQVRYIFDELSVCVREYYGAMTEKDKKAQYYEDSIILFENMLNGVTINN